MVCYLLPQAPTWEQRPELTAHLRGEFHSSTLHTVSSSRRACCSSPARCVCRQPQPPLPLTVGTRTSLRRVLFTRFRPCSAPTGPRDFARLNKAALSQGLVTAKEQRAFREVHGRDFEQRSRPTSAASTGRRSREMPLPVGPDHVFGVKTQRSDDISAVMS